MAIRYRIYCAISAVLLAALACAIPGRTAFTPTPQAAAPTLAAPATPSAEPTTPVPTQAETATETATAAPLGPTETATLPVGVFPTDTPTPTLEPIYAEVMKVTNCRTGPAGNYELVATYQTGDKLLVIARDLGGGFVFVQDPNQLDVQCYVLLNNVRLSGDTSVLPQYTPLASPTAGLGIKVDFKKYDTCKGDPFAQFTVVNTGGVPFRSAYVKVTDLKTGKFSEWSVDAFDLWTACIIAKNIAPLNPGATGYLRSELFLQDPRGDKMRAIIHACTEKALKGTCVDVVIPFQ